MLKVRFYRKIKILISFKLDLYGTRFSDDGFGPDSLVPVFSTSKVTYNEHSQNANIPRMILQVLTSIVIGLLVDNEMLDYRERIARVWPEYGAGGKEEGTVADLMRHELGLPMLSSSLQTRDFSREQIRQPKLFLCWFVFTSEFHSGATSSVQRWRVSAMPGRRAPGGSIT